MGCGSSVDKSPTKYSANDTGTTGSELRDSAAAPKVAGAPDGSSTFNEAQELQAQNKELLAQMSDAQAALEKTQSMLERTAQEAQETRLHNNELMTQVARLQATMPDLMREAQASRKQNADLLKEAANVKTVLEAAMREATALQSHERSQPGKAHVNEEQQAERTVEQQASYEGDEARALSAPASPPMHHRGASNLAPLHHFGAAGAGTAGPQFMSPQSSPHLVSLRVTT